MMAILRSRQSNDATRLRVPAFLCTPSGAVGLVLTLVTLAVAVFGGLFAPHTISEPLGSPGQAPGSGFALGLDFLGRDVISRTLHGGLSVVLLGTMATVLAYVVGLPLGLIAGYNRGKLDAVLMRCVDIVLAVPAIVLLLLLVSGLGTKQWVLVVGVALVHLPGVARVLRTTVQEVAVRSFVEAAVARGERLPAILRREILPNIREVVLADLGIRFGWSVIIIASMNFLGLGLQPPAADWGLMISENRDFLSVNPWATAAPAALFAALVIGINLLADSYARATLGTGADVTAATEQAPIA
jgi:peptide/nickel transport system permease protein